MISPGARVLPLASRSYTSDPRPKRRRERQAMLARVSHGHGGVETLVGRIAEIVLGAPSADTAWPAAVVELERVIGFDSGFVATTTGSIAAGRGAFLGHDEDVLR